MRPHLTGGSALVAALAFCLGAARTGEERSDIPPDKSRIVFVTDRDGNEEIYTIRPDGTDLRRLTDNPAKDYSPAWSPDGGRIAFTTSRDGNDEIYVMDQNGKDFKRLTENGASETYPRWSPDGKMIVFQSDRDGNNEIYVMKSDGTQCKRLTSNQSDDGLPSWSSDGKKILFCSDRNNRGTHDCFMMNADGGEQERITTGIFPQMSPTGDKIAFLVVKENAPREICTVNIDGTNLRKLGTSPNCTGFCWSPDGCKLATAKWYSSTGFVGGKMFLQVSIFEIASGADSLVTCSAARVDARRKINSYSPQWNACR